MRSKLLFALTILSVVCITVLSAGCTSTYEYVDTEEMFADYIGDWEYEDDDIHILINIGTNGSGYIEFSNESGTNCIFTKYYDGNNGAMMYAYKGVKTIDGKSEEYEIKGDLGRLWIADDKIMYTDADGKQRLFAEC